MMCTYYNEHEVERHLTVSDKDIDELLQEVNKKRPEGRKFFIRQSDYCKRKFLKKPEIITLYSLYAQLGGGEAQCINFCQEHEWSINTNVRKSYIITFLLGFLAGNKLTPNPTT
jgi:hypothetical protein